MGQQAIVARTGFDEEREVHKRVLNALTLNASWKWTCETNRIELNTVSVVRASVSLSLMRDVWPIDLRQPTHELTNQHQRSAMSFRPVTIVVECFNLISCYCPDFLACVCLAVVVVVVVVNLLPALACEANSHLTLPTPVLGTTTSSLSLSLCICVHLL
jgi:hypothetical protein